MGAEKGTNSVFALVLVVVLLLGSIAFVSVSNAATPSSPNDVKIPVATVTFSGSSNDAEYLIITRLMFLDVLQPLENIKSQRMSVKALTVEEMMGKALIYPSDDVHATETETFAGEEASQLKFNISTVPAGRTIVSVRLFLYCSVAWGWVGGGYVMRVGDQTWTESITHGEFRNQSLTNLELFNGKWLANGWDWIAVKNQFLADYNAGNLYSTFRLNLTGTWWGSTGHINNGQALRVGSQYSQTELGAIEFYSKDSASYRPYLEVTYSPGGGPGGGYPGMDIPEQIRNCIKDHYENHGTKWVLLAGDVDSDGDILDKDWEVPLGKLNTDYYYAGLDKTWDNFDEVDWEANVYVGRITARDASTMQAIVDKTVRYETSPPRKFEVCLFSASDMNSGLFSSIRDQYIPLEVSTHGFYEADGTLTGGEFPWAINEYNPILVGVSGHGNPWEIVSATHGSIVDFGVFEGQSMHNKGFLMYADSCQTNAYGFDTCLGEAMLQDSDGGAVGYVGYMGYGWQGEYIPVEEFFKEIFLGNEYHQGAILYKSAANIRERRDLVLGRMLLGDPELKIVEPVFVSISPDHGGSLPGTELTYTVTVQNMSNREETYILTVTEGDPISDWDPTVSPTSLTVPADENRTATLSVTVPPYVSIGGEYRITVTATSTENFEANDSASCIAYSGLIAVIYPSAAISTDIRDQGVYFRSQLKFDISNIPPNLASIKLWLYRSENWGSWDGHVRVNRVDDQAWDENITADQFNAQLLTHQQDYAHKWISDGWDYVNYLTRHVESDYCNAGNIYTSFRLRWTRDDGTQPAIYCSSGDLGIGSSYEGEGLIYVRDPYLEVIYAPWPEGFSLINLYKVGLGTNLYLDNGSKLVVKFYNYANVLENEVIFENFTPPAHVVKFKNIPHPSMGTLPVRNAVKRADLVLTTDNTENVVSTIASFTVHQSNLRNRIGAILTAWAGNPGLHSAFRAEVMDILSQWAAAPA